jgi:hypothetical protein
MWHAWGRGEVLTGFWLGGPKVRDQWEDLGVGGKITLRWHLWRQETYRANWIRLAQDRDPVVGICEHGNEPLGSIKKVGYFLMG